jgi:uncharacterized protein
MNILIDLSHPAHVHLFRNAIKHWVNHCHNVVITIRDKDITADLLKLYGYPFTVASKKREGLLGLTVEMIEHDRAVYQAARRNKSKILMGTSVAVSHVARLVGGKAVVFNEDDEEVAKVFTRLAYPLAHYIVTPDCLPEDHGKKHITYSSYQKLAYLHPNVFSPDPKILNQLGVETGEPYFIIRLVSLRAAHDIGEQGIDLEMQRRLINLLAPRGKVFITNEKPLPSEFDPYQLPLSLDNVHHAIAFSTLFIGDSQSMAVEAAVMGVPSIRCNTFARRCSVLLELEHRYDLTYAYLPSEEDAFFQKINLLLDQTDLLPQWKQKRECMLQDKIDLTAWMVDFIENLDS